MNNNNFSWFNFLSKESVGESIYGKILCDNLLQVKIDPLYLSGVKVKDHNSSSGFSYVVMIINQRKEEIKFFTGYDYYRSFMHDLSGNCEGLVLHGREKLVETYSEKAPLVLKLGEAISGIRFVLYSTNKGKDAKLIQRVNLNFEAQSQIKDVSKYFKDFLD